MVDAEEKRFDELRQKAVHSRPVSLLLGRHNNFDPAFGGGPYFLRVRRTRDTFHEPNPFVLKYKTLDDIAYFLESRNGANK
jgi:hypothetical protein